MKKLALFALTLALLCAALPAGAQETPQVLELFEQETGIEVIY